MGKKIFVIGLDEWNQRMLERLPDHEQDRFLPLLPFERLRGVEAFDFAQLLEEAERHLAEQGPPDAITTCIDFPATELVPVLAQRRHLRGPTLEQILRAGHKLWSRQLQAEICPENVPAFAGFDPYEDHLLDHLLQSLQFPFWIKPVNAYRSQLAFQINNVQDFEHALPQLREHLPKLTEPLNKVMRLAELPEEVASWPAHMCIAEQTIGGSQCTLEGYVLDSQPFIYGVVDSVREQNRSSFARYQYPSSLPADIQQQMRTIAENVVRHVGLNNCPFNIEMFYDLAEQRIWLLEINPRISQSHCDLFEKVDGCSHHRVMVDIALGHRPRMPYRQGQFQVAAKCFLRAYADAFVERVPTPEEIAELERQIPGLHVHLDVQPGTHLSDMQDQEAYSFELGTVYLGAESVDELLEQFETCKHALAFEFKSGPALMHAEDT